MIAVKFVSIGCSVLSGSRLRLGTLELRPEEGSRGVFVFIFFLVHRVAEVAGVVERFRFRMVPASTWSSTRLGWDESSAVTAARADTLI